MRKVIIDFIHRGLLSFGFGPVVLAIVYLSLQKGNVIQSVTINEVCLGIFTTAALAFVAGGANMIFQIERLPITLAILIHGGILYISYITVYLMNGWLKWGVIPVLVFTGIFVVGYFVVLAVVIIITRKRTKRLNAILEQMHQKGGDYETNLNHGSNR